jgi:elongation factor Ts
MTHKQELFVMAQITTDLLKQLREKTNVGMMDCKKALEQTDGDLDKAIELLRKKGAAVAAKRADNVTDNGRVEAHIAPDFSAGSLVEVSCETDFSANTDAMKEFTKDVARQVTLENITDEAALADSLIASRKLSVKQTLEELIAKITESIKVRRFVRYATQPTGLVNAYIHPGSTLGVMIQLGSDKEISNKEVGAQLAKDICMQIAVMNPLCIGPDQLDANIVAKEKALISEQLAASGKPANVIEKIMQGKLEKFYEDACLMHQKYIKNDKLSVGQHVEEVAKQLGVKITVEAFTRFGIGK